VVKAAPQETIGNHFPLWLLTGTRLGTYL